MTISSITLPYTTRTSCLLRTFSVGLAVGGYQTLQRLPTGWAPAQYPAKVFATLGEAKADIGARIEHDRDTKDFR